METNEKSDSASEVIAWLNRIDAHLPSKIDVVDLHLLIASIPDDERSRLLSACRARDVMIGFEGSTLRIETGALRIESGVQLGAPRNVEALFRGLVAKKSSVKLARAPGFTFCRLIGHICSKTYRERVLEAFHAEVITDYTDALATGDLARARMIRICMYPQMAWQVFGALISQLASAVHGKSCKTSGDN
jgi:hypothetical protein